MMKNTATCNALQHTATHCNTLQHTETHCNILQHAFKTQRGRYMRYDDKHCNTLQHTATHWNTLQHTATHCNTLQHTEIHCNILQHAFEIQKGRSITLWPRPIGCLIFIGLSHQRDLQLVALWPKMTFYSRHPMGLGQNERCLFCRGFCLDVGLWLDE